MDSLKFLSNPTPIAHSHTWEHELLFDESETPVVMVERYTCTICGKTQNVEHRQSLNPD